MDENFLLLLDADDTLWESALYFQRAEKDFLKVMESLGFSSAIVRDTVHRRDLERLSVTGYGAGPYMDTLVSILEEFMPEPPEWSMRALADIRTCLLGHPVVLIPGVNSTLETVGRMPVHTVVYTMGEEDHQSDKFRRSGLTHLVNELTIVSVKDSQVLAELMYGKGFVPERTILMGNSPRSDINPATELGIRTIFLKRNLTWSAEHEDFRNPELVTEIDDFSDLADIMDQFISGDIPSYSSIPTN
jgi:putative hydrolase of the HAD superfamily